MYLAKCPERPRVRWTVCHRCLSTRVPCVSPTSFSTLALVLLLSDDGDLIIEMGLLLPTTSSPSCQHYCYCIFFIVHLILGAAVLCYFKTCLDKLLPLVTRVGFEH
ncbi:hypothetical protein V1264_007513 [Littorina saxatilis]|uniref:Uncharacterized protein n=1 Tax=Littorina saxatilis TaxID=31220 RepID=A0AAN9AVL7_9CAEN